jgi:inward rectifier potassium channel
MAKDKSRTRRVNINNRTLLTRGLQQSFWRDLNHRAMTAAWPQFFLSAAAVFLCFNLLFAALYALGDKPVANTPDNGLIWLLYFSFETLATVGYGDMHPQTHWGHAVATVEIFTGLSFLAVYTGLIFARFSRPTARFMFAHHAVIGPENGKPTLMIRIANERQNTISGANARLWLLRDVTDSSGRQSRRFIELKLLRTENPVFALSWTLYHEIDANSALRGLTREGLEDIDGSIILTLTGVDDSSGMNLHARHSYSSTQIKWQHRFSDIIGRTAEGETVIDYGKLHDVVKL